MLSSVIAVVVASLAEPRWPKRHARPNGRATCSTRSSTTPVTSSSARAPTMERKRDRQKPLRRIRVSRRMANPTSAWSKLIAADTLESEVKRLNQSLATSVTTPSQFKGGGYKDARREFSELAVLFAVTAQYDGDARWKDAAAGIRELFSRAGFGCKAGTDESYREATACKQELADIVRGSRPQLPKAEAAVADWSKVAARPPLMQRMNIAHEERLTKWLADAGHVSPQSKRHRPRSADRGDARRRDPARGVRVLGR